jgi:hypothetical protein
MMEIIRIIFFVLTVIFIGGSYAAAKLLQYNNSASAPFILIFLCATGICALILGMTGCATPQPAPVIVQAPAPIAKPTPISDPYTDLPTDEADAIRHGRDQVFHHGVTTVMPYSPDRAYKLNCQPLHVTQVRLAPNETTDKNNVRIGDKNRWGTLIGDHVVLIYPRGHNTTITVSVPGAQVSAAPDPDMKTNLVIATSLGNVYTFDPVEIGKPFTEAVEFYYPLKVRAQDAARQAAIKEGKQ